MPTGSPVLMAQAYVSNVPRLGPLAARGLWKNSRFGELSPMAQVPGSCRPQKAMGRPVLAGLWLRGMHSGLTQGTVKFVNHRAVYTVFQRLATVTITFILTHNT